MTKTEFKRLAKEAFGSIYAAGPRLGIGRRHAQRLADGDAPVPKPIAKLLTAVIKHPQVKDTIEAVE